MQYRHRSIFDRDSAFWEKTFEPQGLELSGLDLFLEDIPDENFRILESTLSKCSSAISGTFPRSEYNFSGSITKHTFLFGGSDIDVLVFVPPSNPSAPAVEVKLLNEAVSGICPRTLHEHYITLNPPGGVNIDLVPAFRSIEGNVHIPDPNAQAWIPIFPNLFAEDLDALDKRHYGALKPAIRLTKWLTKRFLTVPLLGHHIELLMFISAYWLSPTKSPLELLSSFLNSSSHLVLTPLRDTSKQRTFVDDYLGEGDSPARRTCHRELKVARDFWNHTFKAVEPKRHREFCFN